MENNNGEEEEKAKVENNTEGTNGQNKSRIEMVWCRVKTALIKLYHVCKSLGGLIFLLVIYNVLGALLFQSIESKKELEVKEDMNKTRQEFLTRFYEETRNYWVNPKNYNQTWIDNTLEIMKAYEGEVRALGTVAGPETVWTFWSALFFCGTIYTTIGMYNISYLHLTMVTYSNN